jgi:hypothetical protein
VGGVQWGVGLQVCQLLLVVLALLLGVVVVQWGVGLQMCQRLLVVQVHSHRQ